MLARANRLRSRKDLARVYRQGKTLRSGSLMLKWAPNQQGSARTAVVVSKKVAPSAPVRNRIRRRIYELLRQHDNYNQLSVDSIVSVFAAEVADMPADKLKAQVYDLVSKVR